MNQKTLLKILGEKNPLDGRSHSFIVGNVPIYSNELLPPVNETIILNRVPSQFLAGLRLICDRTSPVPIDGQTGWYHKLFKVAWIQIGDRPLVLIHRSILHEVGHHVWVGTLSTDLQRQFQVATKKCRGGPNDWSDPEERFADAFATYILGNSKPNEFKVIQCLQSLIYYQQPA